MIRLACRATHALARAAGTNVIFRTAVTRSRLRARLSPYGRELPASFWYLWFGTVINRLGGIAVPFLMLYLTTRLAITPQTAALVVSVLGAGSFLAQLSGGELSDRFGRRPVMMMSFLIAPVAMLALGLVRETWMLVIACFFLGFFTDLFRPAMSAAIVDLVPAEKRTRAFGYIYWAINFGAALAPILAGLLANFDYFLLFAGDALTTVIFGLIVLARVPETQAVEVATAARIKTRSRLGLALRDPMLLAFVFLSLLVGLIYSQSHVTLPIDMAANGLPPSDYGLAIAVNGALIVLVTLQVARRVERLPRYGVMAVAGLLLGVGFGLTAFAGSLPAFAFTVAIWTIGEVIGAAVAPVIVSEMSPPEMRGLYQGVWGSSWGLAFFLGPALGGFVFQQYGPDVLWAGMFGLGILLFVGYLSLSIPARRRAQAVASTQAT